MAVCFIPHRLDRMLYIVKDQYLIADVEAVFLLTLKSEVLCLKAINNFKIIHY
jgi:hypothetical protein